MTTPTTPTTSPTDRNPTSAPGGHPHDASIRRGEAVPPATAAIIRPRERDAVLTSLRAGVVPKLGFAHLQVGRAAEVSALTADLSRVADGGSEAPRV